MNKVQIEKFEGQLAALCADHGISSLGVTFMFRDDTPKLEHRFGALFIPNPRVYDFTSFAIHKQVFDVAVSAVKAFPTAKVISEGRTSVMVVSPKPDNA